MHKKLYDALRIAQIVIPALGTLYAALANPWGWAYAEQVVATCGAVTAFIGVILKEASNRFFDDHIIQPKELTDEEKRAIMEGEDNDNDN